MERNGHVTVVYVYRNYEGLARSIRVREVRDAKAVGAAISAMVDAEVAHRVEP